MKIYQSLTWKLTQIQTRLWRLMLAYIGLSFLGLGYLSHLASRQGEPAQLVLRTSSENMRGGDLTIKNGLEIATTGSWSGSWAIGQTWLTAHGWDGSACVMCGKRYERWDCSSLEVFGEAGKSVFHGCRTCFLAQLERGSQADHGR